jgi:hypothetical protein
MAAFRKMMMTLYPAKNHKSIYQKRLHQNINQSTQGKEDFHLPTTGKP